MNSQSPKTNTACRNPQTIVHSTCFVNLQLVMSTHLTNFRVCIAGGLSCLQPGRRVILPVAEARHLARNCVNQSVKASQPDYVFGRFELVPGQGQGRPQGPGGIRRAGGNPISYSRVFGLSSLSPGLLLNLQNCLKPPSKLSCETNGLWKRLRAFGDLQKSLEASQDLRSPLRNFEGREKPLKASKDFSKPHMQTCICFHTALTKSLLRHGHSWLRCRSTWQVHARGHVKASA